MYPIILSITLSKTNTREWFVSIINFFKSSSDSFTSIDVISRRGTMQSRTRSFFKYNAFSNNSVSTSSSSSPSFFPCSLINFSKSTDENSISCPATFMPNNLNTNVDSAVINNTPGAKTISINLYGITIMGNIESAKTLNKTLGINSPNNKITLVEIMVCVIKIKSSGLVK